MEYIFFFTYLDTMNIQRMWIQYMEFFQLQIFAWGWLHIILNLEIFAPCAKQIGRSHPTKKQIKAVKQLFEQNQDLNSRHNCSSRTGNSWNNYCTWLRWKIRKFKQTQFELQDLTRDGVGWGCAARRDGRRGEAGGYGAAQGGCLGMAV